MVCAREPDGHGISGRPRCDVQAHERLGGRAQVLAEGRARGLRGAQLRLGQQRDVLERLRAGQPLAVEGRAALQVGELGSQRRGIGHARTLADPQRDGPPGGRPVVAMLRGECRVRWRRVRSLRGSLRRMTQGTQDASRRRRPGGPSWHPPGG